MSDLIKVRRENGRVVAERIESDIHCNEIVDYATKKYIPTMNYERYGFEKPVLGIGCGERCILPMDNSERFYGYSEDGLVMICLHLEDAEEYGKDLYLMYDDYREGQGWTEEKITIIKR